MTTNENITGRKTEIGVIGIAADHGGFALKQYLLSCLRTAGYEVTDFGAYVLDKADDYRDFIVPLAKSVSRGEIIRGIAICGSGVGACMAVNNLPGVRAALIGDSSPLIRELRMMT